MVGTQNTNERLAPLKEVVAVGLEIETAFQDAVQRDFKGREPYDILDEDLDDYFVYQFLHNALTHARSAVVLAENGFSKQLMLVARTILEGWFFFKSFMNTRPAVNASARSKKCPSAISKKWRSFHIYQAYQSIRKSEDEVAAIQMLSALEDRVGIDLVKQAENQFDFQNEKERWHKRGNLKALIEVDGDPSLLSFYEDVYSVFSQVQHWDPVVVIATEIPSNMALGPIFHNIFRMILYINNFYNLKFEDELNDMYRRVMPLLFREVLPLS
jgi:hypothetical protein